MPGAMSVPECMRFINKRREFRMTHLSAEGHFVDGGGEVYTNARPWFPLPEGREGPQAGVRKAQHDLFNAEAEYRREREEKKQAALLSQVRGEGLSPGGFVEHVTWLDERAFAGGDWAVEARETRIQERAKIQAAIPESRNVRRGETETKKTTVKSGATNGDGGVVLRSANLAHVLTPVRFEGILPQPGLCLVVEITKKSLRGFNDGSYDASCGAVFLDMQSTFELKANCGARWHAVLDDRSRSRRVLVRVAAVPSVVPRKETGKKRGGS